MRQTLIFLFIAVLFSSCVQLTTRNIVLVERLKSMALAEAQENADCEEFSDLAMNMANQMVMKAVYDGGIECEDPPCDWPDTIDLRMQKTSPPEEQFLSLLPPCDDPPCDWPDTNKVNPIPPMKFTIGYSHFLNQRYEFKIVDDNNNLIASSNPAALIPDKLLKTGKLVRATFKVVNSDYEGEAKLIMKHIDANRGKEQEYRVTIRIHNF